MIGEKVVTRETAGHLKLFSNFSNSRDGISEDNGALAGISA